MITYSKIGKKGHLGNQLFQIASTIGLAVANNQKYSFLNWKYQEHFKNKLPLLTPDFSNFTDVEEKEYNFHSWDLKSEDYDLSGWLQTEKYFDKELTTHYFEFSGSLTSQIKKKYESAFAKRTILLSIRRGDFVNHPDYFQLPINYYLNSLAQFFPNWESCNLIVLSDDIKYCKFHFSFLENAFFGDGLNEIEQLCLGSLCDDFIISNSTFSWWTAWLGEKSDSKIIRPLKNFDGLKSQTLNDKDYYPERWIKYNHLKDKINLQDVIFDIRTKQNNKEIAVYILNYFDVEICSDENEIGSSKNMYVLKKDYFLPPLVIFSSYLKLKNTTNTLIVNHLVRSFNVSKALDYKDFLLQKDFGMFSDIFTFSKTKEKSKNQNYQVYLKRKDDTDSGVFQSEKAVLYISAGKFCFFGAYKYSFLKLLRSKKVKIKTSIKNILLKK